MSQGGTIALVGSGEYLPKSDPLDRQLLERIDGTPSVVVIPTAAAPDGPGSPERWNAMGREHFTRLGAHVQEVLLLTRMDAESSKIADIIAASNFVYLSGGKPSYLFETLSNTASLRAIQHVFEQGGVVAGCSAGAMALAGEMLDWPQLWQTKPGLGFAPGLAVIPHFDEIPKLMTRFVSNLTHRITIAGVDGATGLVGAGNDWQVLGTNTVTIFSKQGTHTYLSGEKITLEIK